MFGSSWALKTEEGKVLYTLAGLGEEFEAFVQSVTAREGDVNFVQLQTMLCDLEI